MALHGMWELTYRCPGLAFVATPAGLRYPVLGSRDLDNSLPRFSSSTGSSSSSPSLSLPSSSCSCSSSSDKSDRSESSSLDGRSCTVELVALRLRLLSFGDSCRLGPGSYSSTSSSISSLPVFGREAASDKGEEVLEGGIVEFTPELIRID